IRVLRETLNDPNPAIRLMALDALAGEAQAPQAIISSELHDDDPLLRARAAELMEQTGSGE
ncbi:MAG TPA: HEAT repeat domain-containing protein, partial [Candidatus Binataceae bacterium]